jgi:phospholipase/carboxylesterase
MTSRRTATPQPADEGAIAATGLVHTVWEPEASGPHPTVVMLHGRAGNEKVMWIFARTVPHTWLIVAPRAPVADPDGGYSWRLRQGNEWPALPAFREAVRAVSRFLSRLPALYNADSERVYLMGFSQGAATALATAMYQPGSVRGVAALAGFAPEAPAADPGWSNLKQVPIFMAAGSQDTLVPVSRARECARALQEAGAALEYHEYETGHKLNSQGFRDLGRWWGQRPHD